MRRYGQWTGCPEGRAERPSQCVAEICRPGRWISGQCGNKRGHGPEGLFCKLHGRIKEQGRYVNVPKEN